MRIPNFMLKHKCSLKNFVSATPTGDEFEAEIVNIKCYYEDKVKWNKQDNNDGHQDEFFTRIYFNDSSLFPEDILTDSEVTIVGKSKTYIVVNAQKFIQLKHAHWELILR